MLHTVAEFWDFQRDAYGAGMDDEDIAAVVAVVAADPCKGEVMRGTGGARKFRHARRGGGKRGGFRMITYFAGEDLPVFLVSVFGKGEKDNLTAAERNALRQELAGVAAAYRRGLQSVVRRVK